MAVLLIGSTGSGKSTLGNFLFDPNNSTEVFTVASDNLATTTHTKAVTGSVTFNEKYQQEDGDSTDISKTGDSNTGAMVTKISEQFSQMLSPNTKPCVRKDLTVIDTPGLNEDSGIDLKHMINVVEELQKQKKIQAVIFVVKFDAKIDQQYRDTIKYYSRLRPSLFNHNSIIAMTDYATDERSIKKRQRQKIDDAKMISNVKKEIMECSSIGYEPIVFALDCLPLPGDHEEIAKAKDIRDSLLSCVFYQRSINTEDILVAKTKSILDEDQKFVKLYEGEIEGYNARLKQVNEEKEGVLTEVQQKQKIISDLEIEEKELKRNLEEKDSEDLITSAVWSVDDTWKWFKSIEEKFEINSDWDIVKFEKWDNGRCKWKNFVKERKKVSGVVRGQFMRGFYARVTLETTKKLKFANEIKELKLKLKINSMEQEKVEKELQESYDKEEAMKKTIDSLTDYIKKQRKLILMHGNPVMTLEEAQAWLE